jgi:hypothetical protein
MKRIASIASVLEFAILVAGPAVATPALADPAPSSPRGYVQIDGTVGVDEDIDWGYVGASIGGGYGLADRLWLHGEVGEATRAWAGPINGGLEAVPTVFEGFVIRIGPEWHLCSATGHLCLVAGADLVARTGALRGFGAVPRIGVDAGEAHWRFRAVLEAAAASRTLGPDEDGLPIDFGADLTTGVAYQW